MYEKFYGAWIETIKPDENGSHLEKDYAEQGIASGVVVYLVRPEGITILLHPPCRYVNSTFFRSDVNPIQYAIQKKSDHYEVTILLLPQKHDVNERAEIRLLVRFHDDNTITMSAAPGTELFDDWKGRVFILKRASPPV